MKKKEILTAASSVFQKYGLQKITLDDIAKECGIKKTALYYYFKNKEEIFITMLKRDVEKIRLEIHTKIECEKTPIAKIRTYMITRLQSFHQMKQYFDIFQKDDVPKIYREIMFKMQKENLQLEFNGLTQVLKEGVKIGVFREISTLTVARMLASITIGMGHAFLAFDVKMDYEKEVDGVLEIIMQGIEKNK